MKNLFRAVMLCFMAVSFASCDLMEDKEVCEICGEDPCICEDGTCSVCGKNPCECKDAPMLPSEQKRKLSSVGEKIMDKMPAEEWESYSRLIEDFANSVYASDYYDWGNLEDWFESEYEDIYDENGKLTVKGNKYTTTWTTDIVILMANHTGLFTFTENGVKISDYSGGTKAVFSLNGKTYEAEIKSSGKVTNARYVYEEYSSFTDNGYYDPETYEWVYVGGSINVEEIENISVTVGVPEIIEIRLTENKTPLAVVSMKLTPSFSKEGINPTTDSFSVKTNVSINGYEFLSEKIGYDGAQGKASVTTGFRKDGEDIFSSSVFADAKIKVEKETWDDGDYKESYSYVVVDKAEKVNMSMDILGEIQAKGSVSNVMEASESLDAMWDALYDGYSPDESSAKRHLDNFNAKLDLNVYYDGTGVKQASIEFDLSKEEDYYYGDVYYELIPIIVFGDGSRYKVEEFFTENAFGDLVDSFYEFAESFEDVFGFAF